MEKTNRSLLKIVLFVGVGACLVGIAYVLSRENWTVGLGCLALPIVLFCLIKAYENPVIILFTILIYGFILNILSAYLKVGTPGLGTDFLLVFSYLLLFFKGFSTDIPWNRAKTPFWGITSLWMLYVFLELFNPEAESRVAWFYGMRSMALYLWMFVPLGLVLIDKPKYLKWFLYIWGSFVILATLYGCIQLYVGLNSVERAAMAAGKAKTHMLFGRLRVFSFYTDAGQFGAAQAHAGITALIIAIHEKKIISKLFFLLVAFAGFYGMFISGTRGAMFVPFGGIFLYLFVKRNIRILVAGLILVGIAFYFLKYTYVAHDVYAVRRMRSAFDPEDASFQLRLQNQRTFREYLKSRPFGGGIGTTGVFGDRFSPNGFLANIATDSGFVVIWAETGIVGLLLYLAMWGYVVLKGITIIWYRLKDPWIKNVIIAFVSGIAGVLVANYGNAVVTQVPTSVILCFIVVFIFVSPTLEKIKDAA